MSLPSTLIAPESAADLQVAVRALGRRVPTAPADEVFEFRRPSWQARANCRPGVMPDVWQEFGEKPSDLFYPEGKGSMGKRRKEAIAQVCGSCPVRQECEMHGVRYEREGVWGGVAQSALKTTRRRLGIEVRTLEIDPYTKLTLGTFIPPAHGTPQRHRQHLGQGEKPCDLCAEAFRLAHQERRAEEYQERKRTETAEERRARLAYRAAHRAPRHRA